MIARFTFKNPVLIVGLLFVIIAYLNADKINKDRLIPYSCRAVLVMLDKRLPSGWSTACEKNHLKIQVEESTLPTSINPQDARAVRIYSYRQLANHLVFVANNSPSDSLERTIDVELQAINPQLAITAYVSGKDLVTLYQVTDRNLIAIQIHKHVKVKEELRHPRPKTH